MNDLQLALKNLRHREAEIDVEREAIREAIKVLEKLTSTNGRGVIRAKGSKVVGAALSNQAKAARKRRPWTKTDDNKLRNMIAAGRTYREVGDKIGRTESSVQKRATNIGVHSKAKGGRKAKPGDPKNTGKAYTKADDKRLRKLFAEGLNDAEIGKRMGRSSASINFRRFHLKLKKK